MGRLARRKAACVETLARVHEPAVADKPVEGHGVVAARRGCLAARNDCAAPAGLRKFRVDGAARRVCQPLECRMKCRTSRRA